MRISSLLSLLLIIPLTGTAQEKPRSGVIEGVVVASPLALPGKRIVIESNELVPKTAAKIRYVFDLNTKPHSTVIRGKNIEKAGTLLRVTYVDLELSEMDYFYTGRAIKIVQLNQSDMRP